MKIALVAPLYESVPPLLYGGTERVVSYLCEELVARGHEVTLFAAGDARTSAKLEAICEKSLRLHRPTGDYLAWHLLQAERLYQQASSFDIVHFHTDYLHFPLSRRMDVAHVTTMHGRLDLPDIYPLHQEFNDMPLVSISEAQREALPHAHWVGNVYHGLPVDQYHYHGDEGDYLAFLGRISPEKGLEQAITIARLAGLKLRIAAKVDPSNRAYFEQCIQPLLQERFVEFIGEIGEPQKSAFLGNAKALIFPIDWPEPFGLVMIEALACGTPVIAWRRGSVAEIIEPGRTGFIVQDIEESVDAVKKLRSIGRHHCRQAVLARFSVEHMTSAYLEVYEFVIRGKRPEAIAS